MVMSKKMSKVKQRQVNNANIFHSVVSELNKSVSYMFVGFFANLAHNHFRSKSYIELLVEKESYDDLYDVMSHYGFNHIERNEVEEFFTQELLFKVRLSENKNDFKGKEFVNLVAFNKDYLLWFPSLEYHLNYLNKYNGFYGQEDIRLIKQDIESPKKQLGVLFELYFYYMYINVLHNHSKGSVSCPLCNQN